MPANDTAALVVALSAQLTKFEKDMRAAGIMADRAVNDIEKKFSSMNPQVNASFLGNLFSNLVTKGIDAAGDALKGLIDRFIELGKVSDYAGVSMQWLYGVQEAGRKAGASVDEINAAVKSLAFQLDEMKRGGENALKTLLDANPKFLKGVNRDALDVEQTLRVVANIIAELPNQVQRIDVGRHLGIPPDAVDALRQGGDAFQRVADQAARSAPDLQKIAEYSREIKALWSDFLKTLQDWATTNFFATLKTDIGDIVKILEVLAGWLNKGPLDQASKSALETMRNVEARLNNAQKEAEKAAAPKRIEVTGGSAVDPFARRPGGEDVTAWERQNDQITKHIALMEADTAAVGKNVGEQERLKTIALLKTAADRDGVAVTAEMTRQMEAQAEAAARARMQLAEATYKMQQLNSASQTLGSAISTAFADAVVEGKKLDEVLSSLLKTLAKAAINASIMSLFTPGAGGGASPFLKMLGFAGGTDYAPGGLAVVGEHGPELVNLPRGSQVIPNDVLRQSVGSNGMNVVYQINAAGADAGTVERIRTVLAAHTKAIASQARAMASAQRYQTSGVA